MKKQAILIVEQISTLLQGYQFEQERAENDNENISAEIQEFYKILDFSYDLLTRTDLISSIKVKQPEEMKEPGFDEEYVQKYGTTADDVADFSFSLATCKGEISLRKILRTMINRAGFGENGITMKDVCQETKQGYPNMSRYLAGKQSLSSDNFEKALNFVLNK